MGSNDHSFLFFSQRYGEVRVKRNAIYSLDRRANPTLVFDGSQFNDWQLSLNGPIKDLSYSVYPISDDWGWNDPFPDLSRRASEKEGRLAAGYLDLGLSGFPDVVDAGRYFAMAFEGRFEASQAGEYRFTLYADDQARLFVDGRPVVEFLENGRNPQAGGHSGDVALGAGSHTLRVEFLDLGGLFELVTTVTGPDAKRRSLVGVNQTSGWYAGPGGHAQTDLKQASLFCGIELPKHFELDLEIASSDSPRFVLAFGKDTVNAASDEALRLETWGDELVVVQDKRFEPVMTIEKDMREVRLRLAFTRDPGELRVFGASGRSLAQIQDIKPTAGASGIFIRNQGEDLAVRRLSVYRRFSREGRQVIDTARPCIHLLDGQVVYGRLHVTEDMAYAVDQPGTRHDIDLGMVDRITRPGVHLAVTTNLTELSYANGAIVRGRVERMHSDRMMVRTAFSDKPVTCSLAGASLLRFGSSRSVSENPVAGKDGEAGDMDQLFTASGRLHGRLSFDLAGSPLSWQAPGAAGPLRLANTGAARIERHSQSVTKGTAFNTAQFPCLLHLRNGEVFPCRVTSYDKTNLGFQSPFVKQRHVDSAQVKAIVFLSFKGGSSEGKSSIAMDGWLRGVRGLKRKTSLGIDPITLERALTVPRFNRDHPSTHILVAKNGDLKRGSLLGISAQTVQFESKLHTQSVPIDRLAQVVSISQPKHVSGIPTDPTGRVRVTLTDGSILICEDLAFTEGTLLGHSKIYGDLVVPTGCILDLHLGDFEKGKLKSLFEEWVVLSAQEPQFN